MRCMTRLIATALAMGTAGCELLSSPPTTYGYGIGDRSPSSSVQRGSDPGLPALPRPAPVKYSPSSPQPAPSQTTYSQPLLHQDAPERRPVQYGRDRDRNADGIPDRYQYKQPNPPSSLLGSSILQDPPSRSPGSLGSLGSPPGLLR